MKTNTVTNTEKTKGKMKAFIVGYEPIKDSAVGGFDWNFDKAYIDKLVKEQDTETHTVYRGELEVPDNLDAWQITDFVDNYLEENNWENAFDNATK